MSLKYLLIIVVSATVLSWVSWGVVLVEIDPEIAGIGGLMIFYLALLASLLGTFFLASFAIRKIFNKEELEYRLVGISFRQSVFFSLALIGVLFLQSQNFLTWWNVIFLILALAIFEYFFISYNSRRP